MNVERFDDPWWTEVPIQYRVLTFALFLIPVEMARNEPAEGLSQVATVFLPVAAFLLCISVVLCLRIAVADHRLSEPR